MARIVKLALGALLLSVAVVAALPGPRLTERVWPAFSRDEANSKVGLRVESLTPPSKNVVFSKCPPIRGRCFNLKASERGTIIQSRAVEPHGYFLVVRWDTGAEDGTPLYSYLGKYTFRISIKPTTNSSRVGQPRPVLSRALQG